MKDMKEISKALADLSFDCLTMGESMEGMVADICELAGLDYEKETDLDLSFGQILEKAYATGLAKDDTFAISINIEYFIDCEGILLDSLKYGESQIVKNLNEVLRYATLHCKEDSHYEAFKDMCERFSKADTKLIEFGYKISSLYWKDLDEKCYFPSNFSSVVGYVPTIDNENYEYGQYISTEDVRGTNKGYLLAYNRDHDNDVNVIVSIYEYERKVVDRNGTYVFERNVPSLKENVSLNTEGEASMLAHKLASELMKLTKEGITDTNSLTKGGARR